MESTHIDWSEENAREDIDFTCPFCEGSSQKDWNELNEDERKETREKYNIEARGNQTPDEQDLRTFYEEMENEEKPACGECEDGYLNPIYNYKYPIHVPGDLKEARKTAANCGLFLFEDANGDNWISLMGCGMDLSPNILKCYLEVSGRIPAHAAIDFRQDYRAYLSANDHQKIAEACLETLQSEQPNLQSKIKAIRFFIEKPDELKKRQEEQAKAFNDSLKNAGDQKDPLIRALIGMNALSKATREITQ